MRYDPIGFTPKPGASVNDTLSQYSASLFAL